MAGFINKQDNNSLLGKINKSIKKLSQIGMYYDDMVLKQSHAVGVTEAEFGNMGYMPPEFKYSLAMTDIGQKKFIAYFDKDYENKRDYLRKFSQNSEIEFIIETIADEAVVYDEKNYFCRPNTNSLGEFIEEGRIKEIRDYVGISFAKIYSGFNFKSSHDAWHYFKQFLTEGTLAFEIIYDKEGEEIQRFKELDPISLRPEIRNIDGKMTKIWIQYEDNTELRRELYDTQVIYISYAKGNISSRVSYVERLVRSFNLLRTLENSRVIWNIMNASYRLKMVVPIGNKSMQKAKESLGELLSIYKEDISLNFDSGELTVNGQPTMQFYKNYLVPSKAGEQTEIETIGGDGPDLSDTEALKYFYDKLRTDSKIPFSRFDKESPGSSDVTSTSIDRDEIRFNKFITRLRAIFQEILLKPLLLQISLKYPEFEEDGLIRSNVGLDFIADNIFEEAREMEILERRGDFISSMLNITVPIPDEMGMMNDIPYFSANFLIEKYMRLSSGDMKQNLIEKEKEDKKVEEIKAKAAEAGGDMF